jgi:hypothetical protein
VSSAGPNFPSTGANDTTVGSVAWSNPGSISAQDGSSASAALNSFGGSPSNYLKGTGFGFSIPTGATINGILLEVYRTGNSFITDSSVKLVKGGVIGGTDRSAGATWSATGWASFGGSTDLWGQTWTPADINAASFGAVLSAATTALNATASVDAFRITVYYTQPTTAVSRTITAKWTVKQRVNTTRRLPWGVTGAVTTTRRLPWGIGGTISRTVRFPYTVRNTVARGSQFRWVVYGGVLATRRLVWTTQGGVTFSLTPDFQANDGRLSVFYGVLGRRFQMDFDGVSRISTTDPELIAALREIIANAQSEPSLPGLLLGPDVLLSNLLLPAAPVTGNSPPLHEGV